MGMEPRILWPCVNHSIHWTITSMWPVLLDGNARSHWLPFLRPARWCKHHAHRWWQQWPDELAGTFGATQSWSDYSIKDWLKEWTNNLSQPAIPLFRFFLIEFSLPATANRVFGYKSGPSQWLVPAYCADCMRMSSSYNLYGSYHSNESQRFMN